MKFGKVALVLSLAALASLGFADTLRDSRDGQTYKTVKIGNQTWMAENLNYKVKDGKQSWCHGNKADNCNKYGRLYTWALAQKACPSGWHLPNKEEFEALFDAVGGKEKAGKMLKSTSGWNLSGNGSDSFGFSALPAGGRSNDGFFLVTGAYAYFWQSSENEGNDAYYADVGHYGEHADLGRNDKNYAYSIRCIKD